MELAIIAYAIAALADVVSTRRGLRIPGAREGNPLIAFFMDRFGTNGWIVVKLAVTGGAAWAFWTIGIAWPIWALAALTAAVALRNFRLIRKHG